MSSEGLVWLIGAMVCLLAVLNLTTHEDAELSGSENAGNGNIQ